MMTLVIFFMFASAAVAFGVVNPILKQVEVSKNLTISKESFYVASSALEDVFYRLKNNVSVDSTEVLSFNNATATTVMTNTATGRQIISTADKNNNIRKLQADVALGTGVAFHYGVHSGNGGVVLQNSASILGNVYSNGTLVGSGNLIDGDAISSGANGLIVGINTTGSAYAHTIKNSTIGRDAYYMFKTATIVNGTSYPNSADPTPVDLPISDEKIAEWEAEALAGGVMLSSECDSYNSSSNTCTISTTRSLGPKKIPFNLLIKSSSGVLTVTGHLWVTGNITTQTGPAIKMSSSLGSSNVAFIADNPADKAGSGIIDIGQTTFFQNSGAVGSYIFMISQNNSAETGGNINAITMSQGASAVIAYANHGQITLSQSVSLKQITAYKIILTQSSNVTYDKGLINTIFVSGSGGAYEIIDWLEVE